MISSDADGGLAVGSRWPMRHEESSRALVASVHRKAIINNQKLATLAVVTIMLLPLGCNKSWRPERAASQPAPTSQPATVSDYLPAVRSGTWVYQRQELPDSSESKVRRYVRIVTPTRVREGLLVSRSFGPIADYLAGRLRPGAQSLTGQAPLHGGLGVFLEVAEPLEQLPATLAAGEVAQFSTTLRWYNKNGRLEATGTMSRLAQIEGVETVKVPAGTFENALRVRVEMRGEFPWGPAVKWTTYLWLSSTAGEVRRIEHISGLFWIFIFEGAYEYQLQSWHLETTETGAHELPRWKRGAILFDRTIPKPSIGGGVIDLAEPIPGGVSESNVGLMRKVGADQVTDDGRIADGNDDAQNRFALLSAHRESPQGVFHD